MGLITVFLNSTGRPVASCPKGEEDQVINSSKGKMLNYSSVISSTDEEHRDWAKKNANTKDDGTGLCIPYR